MKKILVLNGHPNKDSFCQALSNAYHKGALTAGCQVDLLNLHELDFRVSFSGTYSSENQLPLEKDLKMAQEKIKWADHLVIVHPVWWGSVPALLKGFFDRVLLPGFAFKYHSKDPFWDKLLHGKTATILYTSDTPIWVYKWFFRAPSVNMLRNRVLGFCGVKTKSVVGFGAIRQSTPALREKYLRKTEQLGAGAL
jgi:NAD(P)H dehydrogenase (quinone)